MKKRALVIAAVMIIATMSISAFAEPDDLPNYKTLTVSGLGADDIVEYYQILAWDQTEDGDPANGWIWGRGIDKTGVEPLDDDNLIPSDIYGTRDRQNIITFDKAGILGSHLTDPESDPAGTNNNGTWTVTGVEPGLYMVVVTSKTPGVIYNPIFVSSNFYGPTETGVADSSWIVTSEKSYSDTAQAKKTDIPLEKKVTASKDGATDDDTKYTTDIGEVLSFEVDTTIPKFGDNYDAPVFRLTDDLTGLALASVPVVTAGGTELEEDRDYTLVGGVGDVQYVIQFTDSYLRGLGAPTDIVVTYDAVVTEEAEKSVNQENNTVTLNFSANPKDITGKAQLKDETNHFTFSLDAELFGNKYGGESGSEAIKVGQDKDGNYILESKEYHLYGETVKHAALEGAEFQLFTDEDCLIPYKDSNNKDVKATSDSMGRITIKGLDVGTYYLKETKAPKGWIKAQEPVEVVISAVINENVTVTDEYDIATGEKVTTTHKTNELTSYTVTVGGSTTTYTMKNSADASAIEISSISPDDKEIVNTKGVELPSTGGIGTTLFYVIGGILVIGAGILLITKRRVNANN